MTQTQITASKRFFQPEVSVYLWVPTIAAPTGIPTRAELTAGTELSAEVADIAGFTGTQNFFDSPDFNHRFVSKLPGRVTAADSSLTFYGSEDGQDIRSVLTRGDRGFLVIMDGGDVAGYLMDIFDVQVGSLSPQRSVDEKAFEIVVSFGIMHPPVESVAIPAAA